MEYLRFNIKFISSHSEVFFYSTLGIFAQHLQTTNETKLHIQHFFK